MNNERSETPRPMSGTSVLIAGATGGLGSAIARDLAARGATLTLTSRQPERLQVTQKLHN